jgi:xylulokinase
MAQYIISYDLGTSSNKSSLFDEGGVCVCSTVSDYKTYYPGANKHEQKPEDWWSAILSSTRELVEKSGISEDQVKAIVLSGQSLTVVPLDKNGNVLTEYVPIWSDTDCGSQAEKFFNRVSEDEWYMRTGNGFARECYSIFKIMKIRDTDPDLYSRIDKIVGSKDYINYLLTGEILTDYSYASGLGAYNLEQNRYDEEYLEAAGVSPALFPEITSSSTKIGSLRKSAARQLGFFEDVQVFCGGVDNSCMALGAGVYAAGSQYLSLGSSAWLAVSTPEPLTDISVRPFIFSHVVPGMYCSATAIFSAGSTLRWLRDVVCTDIKNATEKSGLNVYAEMVDLAMTSPLGSNGLFFNPSLGGIPASYHTEHIKGGFYGLSLAHGKNDVIRSVIEGICMDLSAAYQRLLTITRLSEEVIIVGGGSMNSSWRQMFADVFNRNFVKTSIGQDAAALGAAATAAVGLGWWKDFDFISSITERESVEVPDSAAVDKYKQLQRLNSATWKAQSEIGRVLDGSNFN